MRLALAVLLLACASARAADAPALVLGCGAHLAGPIAVRDADTGVVLLAIPERQALDTDCTISADPLVFDGPSHRAIITKR